MHRIDRLRSNLFWAVCLAASVLSGPLHAQAISCPPRTAGAPIVFPDGAIAMKTALAVNPDGAVASYTPGDHGYTYITNGVNLIENGVSTRCFKAENKARCTRQWLRAEAGAFGPGTPQFCVFAMEVEPLQPGGPRTGCEETGRFVVGNGKGRPKAGPNVPTTTGTSVPTYSSTTSLRHTRDGNDIYVDSAAIPGLVVPRARSALVGSIAWVRYRNNEGFAIVNDTGPAFGEATVALHQLVHTGTIGPLQPIGPIATAERCSAAETGLRRPFVSRPDLGRDDRCRPGHTARGATDIRAYSGIDEQQVTSIILASVKPPMQGRRVTEEITPAKLAAWATAAGFSLDKLRQMANCLPQ